jgi:hypothetical protein
VSQTFRAGPLTFEAVSFPRPRCTVTHAEEGMLWSCPGWTRKQAKGRALDAALFYGYWPDWLRVPTDSIRRWEP